MHHVKIMQHCYYRTRWPKLTWKFIIDRRCMGLWEFIHSVTHEQTGLSDATVTHQSELQGLWFDDLHVRADGGAAAWLIVSRQRPALSGLPVQLDIHRWLAPGDVLNGRRLSTENGLSGIAAFSVQFGRLHRACGDARRRAIFSTHG